MSRVWVRLPDRRWFLVAVVALAGWFGAAPHAHAQLSESRLSESRLSESRRAAIATDLRQIKALGFARVRFLTFAKVRDPAYARWPDADFLSFPLPTTAEIADLREFFGLAAAADLTCEVVLSMPDAHGRYYANGVSDADYRAFIDAIWPAIQACLPTRLYLGGDLFLGDRHRDKEMVANHRRWLAATWPYLVAKCPRCRLGVEVATADATFWDAGADSTEWIKANLARVPDYLGYQLYPSSHAALRGLGFESVGGVDWAAATRDWLTHLRAAAAPITVFADEIGLAVGGEFTPQDQANFLAAAYGVFTAGGTAANVWEFADHPALGDFGMFTRCRAPHPAVATLPATLREAAKAGLSPGIQYTPPEFDDLAWLMPGGVHNPPGC